MRWGHFPVRTCLWNARQPSFQMTTKHQLSFVRPCLTQPQMIGSNKRAKGAGRPSHVRMLGVESGACLDCGGGSARFDRTLLSRGANDSTLLRQIVTDHAISTSSNTHSTGVPSTHRTAMDLSFCAFTTSVCQTSRCATINDGVQQTRSEVAQLGNMSAPLLGDYALWPYTRPDVSSTMIPQATSSRKFSRLACWCEGSPRLTCRTSYLRAFEIAS